MTTNAQIIAAYSSLGLPCVPEPYAGTDEKHLTFEIYTSPEFFGDNIPAYDVNRVYLTLTLPLRENALSLIAEIKQLTFAAFECWPTVTPASDDKQRFVFEFEFESEITL